MEKEGKANLLLSSNIDFAIKKFPIPKIKSKGILMKIELCGVCGTDVHFLNQSDVGEYLGMKYPIALGHEIVGTVEELGSKVKTDFVGKPLKKGDRIGIIPAIHCRKCYFCTIAKTPEQCIDYRTYGVCGNADKRPHFTAGFGQYLNIHDPDSVVLKMDIEPERGVFLEPAAVVVHSMLHARIKPGDTAVVQGVGPIGLLTVAIAKYCGASKVIAIGRKNRKRLKLAEEMGADITICREDIKDEAAVIKEIIDQSIGGFGADQVFNTVGTAEAFEQCLEYVRPSGTIVEVGNYVDSGDAKINPCKHLLEKGIKIIGSFDNEPEHFVRALPFLSDPKIPIEKMISHWLPLSAVQGIHKAIMDGQKFDGREIMKPVIDPWLECSVL